MSQYTEQELNKSETDSLYTRLYEVEQEIKQLKVQLSLAQPKTSFTINELVAAAALSVGLKMYENPEMSAIEATVKYMVERFGTQTNNV